MSKTNKSRKVLVFAGIVILAFAAQAGATPIFSVSVNNVGSSSLHEITVLPGEAFSVDLNVTTNDELYDIVTWVEASASGIFDITGGSYHSPWNATGPIPVGGLDPKSPHGLFGAPGGGLYETIGAGFWPFATIDLLVESGAFLGTYTINVNPVYSTVDPMIPEFYVGNSGPDFIVNVVPEPATLTLLGSGLIVILSCRRRKKAL